MRSQEILIYLCLLSLFVFGAANPINAMIGALFVGVAACLAVWGLIAIYVVVVDPDG